MQEFLTKEENNNNKHSFSRLLPSFLYSKKTNKRILDQTSNKYWLDDHLKLDKNKRRFFLVYQTADNDTAYHNYKTCIYNTPKPMNPEIKQLLQQYDSYKKNSFTFEGQTFKLFKYLLKHDILTENEIQTIAGEKTTGEKPVYLCISRNPTDYLFASTNQSFTSCINMESDYEEAFYMGLPGTLMDNNRCLAFTTTGETRQHYIKDEKFHHFKYINRSWVLINQQNRLSLVRAYPNKYFNFQSCLMTAGFKICSPHSFGDSKFSFGIPIFRDTRLRAWIYIDGDINLKKVSTGVYKHSTNSGFSGTGMATSFSYTQGFNYLDSYDQLIEESHTCCNCDDVVNEGYMYSNSNGDIFCESCYDEIYTRCYSCEEEVEIDNIYYHADVTYCEHCFNSNFSTCESCNEAFENEDVTETETGDYVCQECLDKDFTKCESCKAYYLNEDINAIGYCQDCHSEYLNKTGDI